MSRAWTSSARCPATCRTSRPSRPDTVDLNAGRRRQGAGALPANAGIRCRDQEARPRSRSAGRAAESLIGLSRLPRTAECGRPSSLRTIGFCASNRRRRIPGGCDEKCSSFCCRCNPGRAGRWHDFGCGRDQGVLHDRNAIRAGGTQAKVRAGQRSQARHHLGPRRGSHQARRGWREPGRSRRHPGWHRRSRGERQDCTTLSRDPRALRRRCIGAQRGCEA